MSKPPDERRAELVQAARRLFDERGVGRTRVSDIVKRVGVAQGVFYYYFSSKQQMVEEVIRQVSREVDENATAVLNDKNADFCEKLARFIWLYLDLVDQFLGDDETALPPQGAREGRQSSIAAQCAARLTTHLHTLVEAGAAAGQVTAPSPWESAQVVLYGFRRLAVQRLPGVQMIGAVAEQALGLPKGELPRWLETLRPDKTV